MWIEMNNNTFHHNIGNTVSIVVSDHQHLLFLHLFFSVDLNPFGFGHHIHILCGTMFPFVSGLVTVFSLIISYEIKFEWIIERNPMLCMHEDVQEQILYNTIVGCMCLACFGFYGFICLFSLRLSPKMKSNKWLPAFWKHST